MVKKEIKQFEEHLIGKEVPKSDISYFKDGRKN